ncbi:hypothetical protein KAW48_02170 [candidate division WOR-3 bacterium]|nr:hypothetical protein [candidate division WOR-3 bacterium]
MIKSKLIFTVVFVFLGFVNLSSKDIPRSFNIIKDLIENKDYNLSFLKIEDKAIIGFIGSDEIPIRAKSFTLPSGEYPLLTLIEIREEKIRSILEENIQTFSKVRIPEGQIKDLGHIFNAEIGTKIYWVSKASGAYSFSETKNIMSSPSKIKNHKDAVKLALGHLVELQLIKLSKYETIDVLYVSNVMNAATLDGKEEPFMVYPSDYFVSFGRRYKGIPVIGSYLTLRIGGEGKLFGVQRNWREVTEELDKGVKVDETIVLQKVKDQLLERRVIEKEKDIKKIEIVSITCGYFEGYISNVQNKMGLGCLVNYKHSDAEMISQLVFPIADLDFPLLGVRKQFEPLKVAPEQIRIIEDSEDKIKDEEK